MKTFKFSLVAALAAVVMMTSCIGDGNNEQSFYAIGPYDYLDEYMGMGSKVFYYSDTDYPIRFPNNYDTYFSDVKHIYTSITINFDDEYNSSENIQKNKFYVGTPGGTPGNGAKTDFTNHSLSINSGITEEKLENEVTAGIGLFAMTKKFLYAEVGITEIPNNSNISYRLEYDPNQEVKEETIDSYNNIKGHVYDIYLRIIVRKSSEESTKAFSEFNAFNLQNDGVLNSIYSKEKQNDNNYFALRLNYVKDFDQETNTVKSWTPKGIIPQYVGKTE